MSVRIVVGRAGSGKSYRCFERIVRELRRAPLGKPVYWIVPRQATFSAERWLTCGSGLSAFSRCRIVSFENLADEVIAECGGANRPLISQPGRQMVLGHLLRKHADRLQHFHASSRQPGLAAELISLLDEFGQQGQLDQLATTVDQLAASPTRAVPTLNQKLADLRTLHDAYAAFMGAGRFDNNSRMEHVLRNLGKCSRLAGGSFYIDGFLDLLDFERRMLIALCEIGDDVEMNFCMPPDSPLLTKFDALPADDSLFHRTESAHRALRITLRERQIPVELIRLDSGKLTSETGKRRFDNPTLREIERLLSEDRRGRKIENPTLAVRLVEAPGIRAEVDAVAREVLRLTRAGLRYREIVVLVRDLSVYEHDIAASFREHDLKFFMDRRRDASGHPLVRLVRSIFAIAANGWTTEQVVAICKGGLAGATPELACRLENWAVSRGLRGEGWAVSHPHADPDIEALRAGVVTALKPLIEPLQAGTPLSGRDTCTRLLTLFEALGVRNTLATWMASAEQSGDFETRDEHAQVWREVMSFLEELAELLGSESLTAPDLQTLLLSGLAKLDVGLTPPTVDSLVVGAVERTRVSDARVAIVLGHSEGIFPANNTESGLLSDRERRQLRTQGLSLDADSERRQLDERLIGYLALTRASEQLILTRPTADARGTPLAPGAFWNQLRSFLPQVVVEQARAESDANPAEISTPRQLITGLLHWARDPETHTNSAFPVLYNFLALHPHDESPLDHARHAAWSALSRNNTAELTPQTAAELFPLPLRVTDEQLETFAACPYRHFLKYGLDLAEIEAPEVTRGRISAILHRVLDRLCESLVAERQNWNTLSDEDAARQIKRLAADTISREVTHLSWDRSSDVSRLEPRDRFLLSRVASLVEDIVEAHRRTAPRTGFVPGKAHVSFGDDNSPPLTIPLTHGGQVLVSGKIDRVDIAPDGNQVIAWDYKLAASAVPLARMYHGLALRVLIHLLVLRDAPTAVSPNPIEPVGAFSMGLTPGIASYANLHKWREAHALVSDEAQFDRRRGRGLFNAAHLNLLDQELTPGDSSPLFAAKINKKDGNLAKTSSDAQPAADFALILDHAAALIAQLAERITAGDISIRPYRIGTESACPTCDYAKICRFDPRNGGQYLNLPSLKPAEILARLQSGGAK